MKRVMPIILLITITAGAYWAINQPTLEASTPTGLVGSGAIEAETVAITTEIGGRIVAINAEEGDEVAAGQVLVEIDPSNLLAQQIQLEAALATSQANLAAASALPRPEEIAAAEAQLAQARVRRDGAKITWQVAQALIANPHQLQAQINQAQARVTQAHTDWEQAQIGLKRMEIQAEAASRNQSSHAALVQNEVAQHQLESARIGLQMAEVALAGAKQQVELLRQLQAQPLQLISQANAAKAAYHQAEAAIVVAEANLNAAKAEPAAEDIAVAQAQVAEAEAALAKVQVQLQKLTLTAPRAGLISQSVVQAGELAAPGSLLLELSDIETVDLTIYLAETLVGQVKIGQLAHINVDAYPGEIFEGAVTFINPEAEFTPRNVQTKEERVNLVFGVTIALENPDHRLKPGMPADAELLPQLHPGQSQAPTKALATLLPSPTLTASPPATATPANPSPVAEATATPTQTQASRQVEIVTWGLNVRSGPGAHHPVVTHLAQGVTVPVLEVDPASGWLKVRLPTGEETGWITNSAKYVKIR